ncbi:MAG: 3-hydroxyacyl-CoA dehydrogenase NAD-binding domain-containing protein [Thalassovita sp.]
MSTEARLNALRQLDEVQTYLADAIKIAGQVPDTPHADPAGISTVGVLGAGAMGRGIAMAFAQSGHLVTLVDPAAQALEAAQAHLQGLTNRALKKGKLDEDGAKAQMDRFTFADAISAFAGCDLVVEAVPEIMSLKQKVMTEIEQAVSDDALITSNTSTLDVDAIASALAKPGRFLGTHFFIPAQVNPLLEVIPATDTDPATLALTMALALKLRKRAVIAANGDGFIGNRLFDRFHQEAMYLVEEGAFPQDVDDALEAWGMAIGPFRALDLVGNDIPWGVRKQRAERANPPFQPRIGDALCEAGLYGQKTGRGWYLYDDATPRGRCYEDCRALIMRISRELNIQRRAVSNDEVVGRVITAVMIEAMAILAENRAARGSDIDVVYTTGYGFPAGVGGPMRLADELGQDHVLKLAEHYGQISGRADSAWKLPASLSKEIA